MLQCTLCFVCFQGMYAVGNFQPSMEASSTPPPQLQCPPCSLPHISQEAVLHHLQMKASMAGEPGIPISHSEGLLHRGLQQQRSEDTLKCSSADVDTISPRSPQSEEVMVTFSHTLPRVHTPQAMAAYEEAARRHAATLHHNSMDSSRSKQLLSQWKSKNSHKCSLQVPDSFSSSLDSSGQSSQHPLHHGSMELRSNSEPVAMALNGGFDVSSHAYMAKLAMGASTTLPNNCSGITGGARIAMQSRPGSSQLVHIPEEAHENYTNTARMVGAVGSEGMSTVNSTVQANWQRAAEKTSACRTDDSGPNSQPRMMQVIAMSKQQGLLQTHSKSLDESIIGCSNIGSCQESARYKALTDQDPNCGTEPSSLGSTTGSISGSIGAIIRVEAHPEINRPVIPVPTTDGSGSWRWRSLDHGAGSVGGEGSGGAGGGGGGSLRQSFELNDLNRDSESSGSLREGSIDRKRTNHIGTTTTTVSTSPIVTVHTQTSSQSEQRLHPQGISTIRVTPGDGSASGSGGGGGAETTSETPSVASSRESTLRRKGNNMILIPERANSPNNTRNIFYKGTSITPAFKD